MHRSTLAYITWKWHLTPANTGLPQVLFLDCLKFPDIRLTKARFFRKRTWRCIYLIVPLRTKRWFLHNWELLQHLPSPRRNGMELRGSRPCSTGWFTYMEKGQQTSLFVVWEFFFSHTIRLNPFYAAAAACIPAQYTEANHTFTVAYSRVAQAHVLECFCGTFARNTNSWTSISQAFTFCYGGFTLLCQKMRATTMPSLLGLDGDNCHLALLLLLWLFHWADIMQLWVRTEG